MVFFADKMPGRIISYTHSLHPLNEITLNLSGNKKMASYFFTQVDTSGVYVFAFNAHTIFKSDMKGPVVTGYKPPVLFHKGIHYNGHFYLLGYDGNMDDRRFRKVDPASNEVNEKRLFKAGSPSFDGMMFFDEQKQTILYVSFFSNAFLCIDTGLSIKYYGHTIDTTGTYPKQRAMIKSHYARYLTSPEPDKIVNRACCAYDSFLYINSNLTSDNEQKEAFRSNAVIDIYSVATGQYQGSFYLPDHHNERVKRIAVYKRTLFAVYQDALMAYELGR